MFYFKIKGGLISMKDINKRAHKVILKSERDGLQTGKIRQECRDFLNLINGSYDKQKDMARIYNI